MSIKIKKWNIPSISQAGRTYRLIQLLMSWVTMLMSLFNVPSGVIKKLPSKQSNFWWGKDRGKFLRPKREAKNVFLKLKGDLVSNLANR